jgi:hypothetical protein
MNDSNCSIQRTKTRLFGRVSQDFPRTALASKWHFLGRNTPDKTAQPSPTSRNLR